MVLARSLIPPAQLLYTVPALRDKCLTGSKFGMLDQRQNTLTKHAKCAAGTDMVQKQISKNLRGSVIIVKVEVVSPAKAWTCQVHDSGISDTTNFSVNIIVSPLTSINF